MKLVVDQLQKRFGTQEVLRGASFTFEQGKIYGLIGRNGAGKTLNFLLWCLLLFALIALERAGWGRVLARSRVISRVYMVLMIPLSWLLFAIPSVSRGTERSGCRPWRQHSR